MNLITLDFETFYSKEYSLSKLSTEAYVRDPRFEVIGVSVKLNAEPPSWFSGTMEEVKAWLQQWDIPNSFLLCHHTMFDGFILSHHFGIIAKFYLCTLSMARPLHGQTIGVSLKALSDHYTVGVKGDEVILALGKRRLDFDPVTLAKYGRYCMNDTQLTYMLFQIFKRDFPSGELRVIDLLLRMFIDPVLILDTELLNEHLLTVRRKKEKLLASVEAIAGKDVLTSNPKFALLLRRLGVEPPMKISPANGKPTFAFAKTDLEFKELLQHEDLRVQAVVSARLGTRSTIEESRTQTFLGIATRGAAPVGLGYYRAHTGRVGGEDGANFTNLPAREGSTALSRSIQPPPGHLIINADSSQIEARIVAWLAEQNDLVEAFAAGRDVYAEFASEIYGYPVNKVDHPGQRFVGKEGILSLGFGVGAAKFQNTLATKPKPPVIMSLEDCQGVVNLYRGTRRRIPRLWKKGDAALHAINKGEEFTFGRNSILRTSSAGIHLPNGMMLRYPGLMFHDGEFAYASDRKQQAEWTRQRLTGEFEFDKLTRTYGAKVIENVAQALARIIVFTQMLVIAKRYRVVLTVYDSVVLCVSEMEAEAARDYAAQIMSTPPDWAPGLPVACEVKVGATYGDAK